MNKVSKKTEVKMSDNNTSAQQEVQKPTFAFARDNYMWLIIGILISGLGFILMTGGGSDDPNVFSEGLFSFRRLTLAPILILGGYGVVLYAIMKKPKSE